MSLKLDRRADLGNAPGTHVLLCGVGRYPLVGPDNPAGLMLRDDPSAVSTVRLLEAWFRANTDRFVAPLGTLRVLDSDSEPDERVPTLVNFLRAASAWRDDASSNPDNLTICYLAGSAVETSPDSIAYLLADFGDSVGGLLHNAADLGSLARGMSAPGRNRRVARTQLFLLDLHRVRANPDRLRGALPTPVFDAPLDALGDRNVTVIENADPGPGTGVFSQALIRGLDGEAAELTADGRWAVTTASLSRTIGQLLLEQNAGPDRPRISISGSGSPAVVTRPSTTPAVPVAVDLGVAFNGGRLIARDGSLETIAALDLPPGARRAELTLMAGLYMLVLEVGEKDPQRAFINVLPPSVAVGFDE